MLGGVLETALRTWWPPGRTETSMKTLADLLPHPATSFSAAAAGEGDPFPPQPSFRLPRSETKR